MTIKAAHINESKRSETIKETFMWIIRSNYSNKKTRIMLWTPYSCDHQGTDFDKNINIKYLIEVLALF